jgi:hypothetical protein
MLTMSLRLRMYPGESVRAGWSPTSIVQGMSSCSVWVPAAGGPGGELAAVLARLPAGAFRRLGAAPPRIARPALERALGDRGIEGCGADYAPPPLSW